MKKLITCAAVLSLASGVSHANDSHDYIKGGISYTASSTMEETEFGAEIDLESGPGFTAAVGRHYSDSLSFELELQHQNLDANSASQGSFSTPLGGSISYTSLMLNTLYRPDLKFESNLVNPYIGIGIGATVASGNINTAGFGNIDVASTAASYQVMLGNRFDLDDGWFVDTEYRYLKADNFSLSAGSDAQIELEAKGNQSVVLSIGKTF